MTEEMSLQKRLGQLNIWALAFGCIVGWGAFINPSIKFPPDSGTLGTAIAMLLGASIIIVISCSYAYMIPKYPQAGGEFTFARLFFGKNAAYVCGWFLIASYIAIIPLNATALNLAVDGLFGSILKFGFHYEIAGFNIYAGEMMFAVLVLIAFAWFSIRSVKTAGMIQTFLSLMLAFSVIALAVSAVFSPHASAKNLVPLWSIDGGDSPKDIINSILATLVIAPWAFVGFDTVPQAAEELNFPHKKVRIIMIAAILFGCFVYVANNTVAAVMFEDWPEVIKSNRYPWLLLAAAEKLLGTPGKILVGAAVLSAVLTGIMGFYMASSRLIYSMSRDGYLPEVLGRIDPEHKTPKNAIIFCMVISLSGPVLGREALGWFVDMASIGASVGFGFTCSAAFVLALREGRKSLAVLGLAGAVFSFMFMFLQVVPVPGLEGVHLGRESYIMLAAWVMLGMIFFWYKSRK